MQATSVRLHPAPSKVRMTFTGDRYTAGRIIDLLTGDCLTLFDLELEDVTQANEESSDVTLGERVCLVMVTASIAFIAGMVFMAFASSW